MTTPTTSPASAPAVASASPRGRTRLANDAWEASFTAHSRLLREFASHDVWHGLSMREYDVLYTLAKTDGPQRLRTLERHVLLSQPALSRLVERLIQRGLVSRCADPTDARAAHVSLTQEGRATQRRIGRDHAAAVADAMTAALTDDELRTLESLSRKLARQERP